MSDEILVLDDDVAVLELVGGVLSNAGFRCHTSADPVEALSRVEHTEAISVVIADIYMPRMTGLEFAQRLLSLDRACPRVLLLTAQPSMDAAIDALRLGVCDFLTKPIRPHELLEAVHRATAARRLAGSPELARLVHLSQELSGYLQDRSRAGEKSNGASSGAGENTADWAAPSGLLERIERFRRIRARHIVSTRLDDVAWDLLLELASAEQRGQRLSVSGLMVSHSYVSSTTLLRRVNELVERGFVARTPDPHDARRSYVSLTAKAQGLIAQFLEQVAQHLISE